MNKYHSNIISLSVFLILYSFIVTGCGISPKTDNFAGAPIEEKEDVERFSSYNDGVFDSNYEPFLKKIWVLEGWDGHSEVIPLSFVLTKIENGQLEGKLKTGSLVASNYFMNSSNVGDLAGTISKSVADCSFWDKENEGIISILFKEDGKVDAKIEYVLKSKHYEDLELNGEYSFRPFNLTDLEAFIVNEELSFAVNLNTWGNVCFVTGLYSGLRPGPTAYLTNEQNDIIFEFYAPYQTASEILDVQIADYNDDGLEDIKIISYFPYAPDTYRFEWIFCQIENGLFDLIRAEEIENNISKLIKVDIKDGLNP